MTSGYINQAHRGITLMRNSYNQIYGYGRNPDPDVGVDYSWILPQFPCLPEEMLIRACDGLRYLALTFNVCAAWLLYINQTPTGACWEMLFPNQSHDSNGRDVRLDLRGISMPASARLAGTIASVSPEEFADPGPPLLPSDGLSILIDTSRHWCVARGIVVIAGQVENVQMNHVIWPSLIEQDELARRIVRREPEQ